jgi:hypothetical protein
MNKLNNSIILILISISISCSNDYVYDSIPAKISSFVTHYWPNNAISSFNDNITEYSLDIKNSFKINFDKKYNWISIDGQGEKIPQVFLFDQLPPLLYAYLEETENLYSVYRITRNDAYYQLQLFDSMIYYYIDEGIVSAKAPF